MKCFKKFIQYFPFFVILLNLVSSQSWAFDSEKDETLNNYMVSRPPELQKAIDTGFKKVSSSYSIDWLYNGDKFYRMLGIDDYLLITSIIKNASSSQKEFCFMDLGAGDFSWGRHLAKFINESQDFSSDITVKIISVRGEKNEHVEEILGKCRLSEIGAFKIEDLAFEIKKHELMEIKERVDLIISRWTLRHLADPAGTFIQAYNLLRPSGFFLFDGFFMMDESEDLMQFFKPNNHEPRERMFKFLTDIEAPFVLQHYDEGYTNNRFFMQRSHHEPIQMPWEYAGVCCYDEEQHGWQNAARAITRFKIPQKWEDYRFRYDRHGRKLSNRELVFGNKDLYDLLLNRGLLERTDYTDDSNPKYYTIQRGDLLQYQK